MRDSLVCGHSPVPAAIVGTCVTIVVKARLEFADTKAHVQ